MASQLEARLAKTLGEKLNLPIFRRHALRVLRRTLGSGHLSLVIALVLLTCSAVALRVALFADDSYYQQIKQEFTRTLASTHEPRREDMHMGIVATVLGPLNSEVGLVEGDSAALAVAIGPQGQQTLAVLAGVADDISRGTGPATVELAEDLKTSTPRSDQKQALGVAKRIRGKQTLCISPAATAAAMPSQFQEFGLQTTSFDDTLDKALAYDPSAASPASVSSLVASLHTIQSRNRWRLVQAYAISPAGFIRLWQLGRSREDHSSTSLSSTRDWAAAGYFERMLEPGAPKWALSPAYVDYGGFGVVRTLAHVVYVNGKFWGIVAFDLAAPQARLLEALSDTTYVSVHKVTVQLRDGYPRVVRPIQQVSYGSQPSFAPSWSKRDLERALGEDADWARLSPSQLQGALNAVTHSKGSNTVDAQSVINALRDSQRWPNSIRRNTTSLRIDLPLGGQQTLYWVPLGPPGANGDGQDSGELDALVLSVTPPRPPLAAVVWIGISLVLAAFAFGVLLHGLLRQADRRVHLEKLALLRSLQVGVFEVLEVPGEHEGKEEVILAGNGRAEELLGARLAKPGAEDDFPCRVPAKQFLGEAFLASPHDFAGDLDDVPWDQLRLLTYEELLTLRREGLASSYYAKTASHWVRVRGAPFLPIGPGLHTVGSLGYVSKRRHGELVKRHGELAPLEAQLG